MFVFIICFGFVNSSRTVHTGWTLLLFKQRIKFHNFTSGQYKFQAVCGLKSFIAYTDDEKNLYS